MEPNNNGHADRDQPPRLTRLDRVREIRDTVMARSSRMKPTRGPGPAGKEMRCGPFHIKFYPPGAWGPDRGCNLNVWPAGKVDCGHVVQENKVFNVDWDQRDEIDILTFCRGSWEAELLSLLRGEGDILPFG